MAYTLTDSINYISPFCRYQNPAVGTNNMPIIGIGTLVRNVILTAPMVWDFNRNFNTTYTLTPGQQDVLTNIPDFGYLERASILDPTPTPTNPNGTWFEIQDVRNNSALAKSNTQARPTIISVQNSTGPLLRFSAVPDKAYQLDLVYQKQPVNFANLTDAWSPIPDSMWDIYSNMTLGYYMDSCQDPRASQYTAKGIAGLLSRQEGLSEMDKAVFAQAYMNFNSALAAQAIQTQQGNQARAAR